MTDMDSKFLSERERLLIRFIRRLGVGDVKIRVENGQPVVIYEAIRSIELGEVEVQGKLKTNEV
jgi:hypothetical protein